VALRSTSRALALVLLLLLPGCRERGAEVASTAQSCQRVIALTPSLIETLFALGLGDRVVGVGDYATWPPEALTRPKLGGLFNPNLERIVTLKPDLAVLMPSEKDLGVRLRPLGADILIVQAESLADVERSFGVIARRCGVPEAGERLAREFHEGLTPRPLPGPKLKVMLSIGRRAGDLGEMLVASKGTFFDELLSRLGAENAFPDGPTLYPEVSLEEVVARKPDVILELRADPVAADKAAELIADWQPLGQIPAVRNGRIEILAGGHVVVPGPRLPRLYSEMRGALTTPTPPLPASPPASGRGGENTSSTVSPLSRQGGREAGREGPGE
jgi:iron complex transport system substrate-binding protein